ncbi:basigin-like [Glandiceps talaboti]
MESNFTDAGTYQCIVDITDDVGREDWIKALDSILFMNDVNVTISEDNIRREEGETIHITCSATSYPMPTIIWMKDHALMENTSAAERFVVTVVEDDKSNVVMSTLTLRAITFEDRGAYTCNATTSHNSGNKEYELRIIDRMAAVWPFLGIMCEVIGLIVIILAVERYQTGELVCK